MTTTYASTTNDPAIDTSWRRVLLIAIGGGLINLAIAVIATSVLGMTFSMPGGTPNATIPLPMFALFTIVPVLLGTAIARFLARFGRRTVTAFIAIGFGVAVLSAAMPFTLPITSDAALVLVATHLVAASTFVAASSSARYLAS